MFKWIEKLNERRGLTLVEVLVTVSLISLLSFTLYSSLVNGMKIWKKSQQLVVEEDVVIFFDKISRNLQNVYQFSELKFTGTSEELSFPSLIRLVADPKSGLAQGEYVQQMGKVKYYFDRESGAIYEQKANYGQSLEGIFSEPRRLVSSITNFQIKYYYIEDEEEVEGDAIKDQIPNAIKVEVNFQDGFSSKALSRWISIPVGR